MHRLVTVTGLALAAALAGCGELGSEKANVQVPGPEEVQNRLEGMAEGQRNAVFIRAIRDAGQECQHVESSERAGEHRGFPVWTARCAGGGEWTIVILNDEIAQVLNPAEAQLIDDDQAAPTDAQGR